MDKYEELAALIIDDVCSVVEAQHPEIKLTNKITREIGIEKGQEAVICGNAYYDLEVGIASDIKKFVRKLKSRRKPNAKM